MNEEMIPIVMFISVAVVFCVLFWFRYKQRNDMQQTFRAALEKGQELTPEVIDRLGHPKPAKDKDLRLGIIWLAITAGLVLIGFAIPEPEAFRGMLAGAAFPFCIGVAYMLMHKISDRD
jgi:hypothetical protein